MGVLCPRLAGLADDAGWLSRTSARIRPAAARKCLSLGALRAVRSRPRRVDGASHDAGQFGWIHGVPRSRVSFQIVLGSIGPRSN